MARFKVKEKKSDPDWLEQRKVKKQEKYDKKHLVKKKEEIIYLSIGDLWPEALSQDADREMIGDDIDYGLSDIGCK